MSLYYAVHDVLVDQAELEESTARGLLRSFAAGDLEALSFRGGRVGRDRADASLRSYRTDPTRGRIPFQPIGIGNPLTIRVHQVYPGSLPPKGVFSRGGALVASAVKGWHVFDAQPRALNFLSRSAKRRESLPIPAAVDDGTTLVYYSKAVPDRALTTTFEIAFDDVDQQLFATIGGVFGAAAGLPIFLSAAPYLLAASSLARLGGDLGNRIFDSRAEFQATEILNFGLPGGAAAKEGFALLTRSQLDYEELKDLFVAESGEVRSRATGAPYSGDTPFVVVSLDGTLDPSLDSFTPTAASAALLERFYNIRPGGDGDAGPLVEAMTLYNDLRYREEADKLGRTISRLPEGAEREALEKQRRALLENIRTDEFRPRKE